VHYPYPYSQQVFEELRALGDPVDPSKLSAMHQRHARERTVVLVEREREEPDVPEIAVLNDLALSAAMTKVAARLLANTGGDEIKTIGNLGIYIFEDGRAALEFARRFRALFRQQQVAVRIGMDRGQTLFFDLAGGRQDIAGMPVNLASKIAQDHGEFGRIYLTEGAARASGEQDFERHTFRIAGVDVVALAE
jgi:hypothetical protein